MPATPVPQALRPLSPPRHHLSAVAAACPATSWQGADVEVTGLAVGSADVVPGDLFAALPGHRAHGASYVSAALAAGARAVLTDETGARALADDVPRLVLPTPRQHMGDLAAWFYGYPARDIDIVGVTGTNGKTTIAFLLEAALAAHFGPVALMGTIMTRLAGVSIASTRTTPEAPALQAAFARMREDGLRACAMEISSHALAEHRVDGFTCRVAAFTNLSRDHLDYHGDMEQYFAAKAALFSAAHAQLGVVAIDDEWGRRLARQAEIPLTTLARDPAAGADWLVEFGPVAASGRRQFRLLAADDAAVADDVAAADGAADGAAGRAYGLADGLAGGVPGLAALRDGAALTGAVALPGDYNVTNAALALLAAVAAGVDPAVAAEAIASVDVVPGRMQRVGGGEGQLVGIVDYAHTPESVGAVLAALRSATPGRLIAVLGAGGERDQGKRGPMGQAAAHGADIVIVTDDNPRSEDPAAIRAALLAGANAARRSAGPAAEVIEELADRRLAIGRAAQLARPDDIVVLLGKGHETTQTIGSQVEPFDDAAELAAAFAAVDR